MHHSSDLDDDMKKIKEIEEGFKQKLGPTGKFPEGKLTTHDEGQIRFSVFSKDNKVIIDFNSPVHWLGMGPNEAIDLGNALIKHGRKAQKKGK